MAFSPLSYGHVLKEIDRLTSEYKRRLAVAERLQQQLAEATQRAEITSGVIVQEQKAHGVLLALEAVWRKDFERGIEDIISEALPIIFKDDSRFKIDISVKAGVSAIEFLLVDRDGNETSVMDSESGSRIEVISFLLRVIMIKAARPPLAPVIILDEAFRGLDDQKVPAVIELVRKVADDGIQIIMVTHDERFTEVADQVIQVELKDNVGCVHTSGTY